MISPSLLKFLGPFLSAFRVEKPVDCYPVNQMFEYDQVPKTRFNSELDRHEIFVLDKQLNDPGPAFLNWLYAIARLGLGERYGTVFEDTIYGGRGKDLPLETRLITFPSDVWVYDLMDEVLPSVAHTALLYYMQVMETLYEQALTEPRASKLLLSLDAVHYAAITDRILRTDYLSKATSMVACKASMVYGSLPLNWGDIGTLFRGMEKIVPFGQSVAYAQYEQWAKELFTFVASPFSPSLLQVGDSNAYVWTIHLV